MANKNILTYNAKVNSIEQEYYSPIATLSNGRTISRTYAFLSRVLPWADDANPDAPSQTQQYIKNVYKNIFTLKQITPNNIRPVTPRNDWSANTVYQYYRDDIDILQIDQNGFLVYNFYIKNSYDQVFKCLWNNNGALSTVMPFFQPGTYGSNYIFQGSDNYKWKYIYTVDAGSKRTFMDSTWMPVPVYSSIPGPTFNISSDGETYDTTNQVGAWSGDIEVINVTNGGSGYQNTVPIIVKITGDGTGASGTAVVGSNGAITDIIVTSTGSNYSYANVTITSTSGSGATAIAPVSPMGGHGFDPVSELGCNHVMFTCEFNGSENGIPTSIDYTQVGIIVNPIEKKSYPNAANASYYNATTQLIVSPGFGAYTNDEFIYQGPIGNTTFSATTLNFDPNNNILYLINTTGTPVYNLPVYGSSSGTVRTLLSYNTPNILLPSGYLTYIENRSAVQRSSDGIEQFKFVLGY